MKKWNKEFHNISIIYSDKIIRIKANKALNHYLLSSKGPVDLAQHILKNYEKKFHKSLEINYHSLAIEIIAHVFIDTLSKEISQLSSRLSMDHFDRLQEALQSVRKHTKIIDCGELSVDNNRLVWDLLEPFHSIIYGIVGIASLKKDNWK